MTLLTSGRVVTPAGILDPGWVTVDGGLISGVGALAPVGPPEGSGPPGAQIDLTGRWLLPGLVDLHSHGGDGGSFDGPDAASAGQAVAFHRRSGTTTQLASVVTAAPAGMLRATATLAGLAADGVIAGIHLEGPFLARSRCGAQDPEAILDPDPGLLTRLLDAGAGHVRVVTVAPERPGALALVAILVDAGVIAAIGHSDATYDEAAAAIDAGATLATHLYNGMRPFGHRDPGIVGACLVRAEVRCELIADGFHLDPAVLRLTVATAHGRAVLVSDSMQAAGRPDGRYRLGSRVVTVAGGRAVVEGSDHLAGSVAPLAAGLRHAVVVAGVPMVEAVLAAATRPADMLGLHAGRIEVGAPADLVVLDEDLRPSEVLMAGRPVT